MCRKAEDTVSLAFLMCLIIIKAYVNIRYLIKDNIRYLKPEEMLARLSFCIKIKDIVYILQ